MEDKPTAAWKRLLECGQGLRSGRRSRVAWLVLLLLYTTARIVANSICLLTDDYGSVVGGKELSVDLLDGFARPVISGLGVYHCLRRSATSELHVWCRRILFCTAWCGLDPWFSFLVYFAFRWEAEAAFTFRSFLFLSLFAWLFLCNALQFCMTNLKLKALGFCLTARVCQFLTAAALCCTALVCVLEFVHSNISMEFDHSVRNIGLAVFVLAAVSLLCAVLLTQCVAMSWASCRALRLGKGDRDIECAACSMIVCVALTILGPSVSTVSFFVQILSASTGTFILANIFFVTVDISLQILYALLLAGRIGPKGWAEPLEAYQKIAALSAVLSAKRISFPGKIHKDARDCIVSFPGKYSLQWDDAVLHVRDRSVCSMACVFLTDKESGLGEHADNPEEPGECWCKALYGQVPAQAYLSVLDHSHEVLSAEAVAVREADAAAMGQILVVRHQRMMDFQWHIKFARAAKDAEDRCRTNLGRAPWGCRWFEEWRKNVEQAVELGQNLHVFYFEGKVGTGKLSWEQLSSDEAVQRARQNSGLGLSQTAEVAYLERMGWRCQEHDVTNFEHFMCTREEGSLGTLEQTRLSL